MQTFLPFPDFAESAAVLDDRRLGKQRVETLQILRALHLPGYGWSTHPAVTMWRGHTDALVTYGVAIVDEWVARGHADSTRAGIAEFVHPIDPLPQHALEATGALPPWLGDDALHRSHRSNLVRKDPDHYGPAFPGTPGDLDYVWPDPPAPQLHPGRRDAWVVRCEVEDDAVHLDVGADELPWVPLDARSGRTTKRDRQLARFIEEMADGHTVVVPDGDDLVVALLVGDLHQGPDRVRRSILPVDRLPRTALDFPAALQDPQDVFALHDEPVVRALASTASGS